MFNNHILTQILQYQDNNSLLTNNWLTEQSKSEFTNGLGLPFAEILLTALAKQEQNASITPQQFNSLSGQKLNNQNVVMAPINQLKEILPASPQPKTSTNNATNSIAELKNLARQIALKHQVNPALVQSVIQAESSFNPRAVSKAGAQGLMQLMPKTASALGVKDPFDPVQNIDGGVRYLKQMLNRYGGNTRLALAAYNAGPGTVDRAGGIPNIKETKDYIQKVLKNQSNMIV